MAIGFEEFFDPSMPEDIRKTAEEILRLRKAYEDFANAGIADQLERLGIKQSELVKTILALSERTKELNVTNKAHQDILLKQQQVIDDLVVKYELLRKTKAGVTAVTNQVSDSINALTLKLKAQVDEWKALSISQDPTKMKRLAQEIANTRNEITTLTNATRASNAAILQTKGSYNELSKATQDLIARYKSLENATGANRSVARSLAAQIKENTAELRRMDNAIDSNFRKQTNLRASFGGVSTSLTSLALNYISLRALISGFNEIIDQSKKFEALATAIKAISTSNEDYAASQRFLLNIANKYGQDITTLTHSYITLTAATKNTQNEGVNTKRVFEAVIQAGTALKLSNENIEGSLIAIQQMFSKGTVQAQELRTQLAERLPGSFRIMAEAIGVSEVQLNKMLQRGEVLAKDVLPKFAERLSEIYGPASIENAHVLVSETNRFTTQWQLLLATFADVSGIKKFWTEFKAGMADTFSNINYWMKHSKEISWTDFFQPEKQTIKKGAKREREMESGKAEFETMTPEKRRQVLNEEQKKAEELATKQRLLFDKEVELKKDYDELGTTSSAGAFSRAQQERQANSILLNEKADYLKELIKINSRLEKEAKVNASRVTDEVDEKKKKADEIAQHKAEVAARKAEEELRRAQRTADQLAQKTAKESIATEEFQFVKGGGGDYIATIELEKRKLDILEKSYAIRLKIYQKDSAEYLNIQAEKLDSERKFELAVLKLKDDGIKNKTRLEMAELEFQYGDKTGLANVEEFEYKKMGVLTKGFDERIALYKKDSDEYNKILIEKVDAERKSQKTITEARKADLKEQKAVAEKYSEFVDAQNAGAIALAVHGGSLTEGEGETALHNIRKSRLEDAIHQKELEIGAMKDKDKEYYDSQKALSDLQKNLAKENADFSISQAEREKQKKEDLLSAYFQASADLAQSLFDLGSGLADNEIQREQEKRDRDLEAAGNNAAAKKKIEENFQKDVAKIKRKQAIFDKLSAAFNIGIHLAETIMKNNAEFGVPAAIPLNILAGFQAAAALALVLSKPIPQYEKGRRGGKEELALINENGAEFIKHNGQYKIAAAGKKTLTVLPEGADVIPARQTKKILEEQTGLRYVDSLINGALAARDYEDTARTSYIRQLAAAGLTEEGLGRKFKDAVSGMLIQQTIFDEKGFTKFWKNKHSRVEDLNSRNTLGGRG